MATARRGRPREGESELQREAVLEAAFELLLERGYRRTTMTAIAERAGSSKETLYKWFGDKPGLFAALVRRQAEAMNERVVAAFDGGGDLRATLVRFATDLLELLLGTRSLAINRAAMAELVEAPALAEVLLSQGRHRSGPLVVAYLGERAEAGELALDDPRAAFGVLYGLAIQDAQIRSLLGEATLSRDEIPARAEAAVDAFLALFASS
jgi:AcrR family transcriptional regulator